MKKKIVLLISCLLLLGGCANNADKTINPSSLAELLLSKGSYDNELVLLDKDEIGSFYFYEESLVEEAIVYISKETSADEIAIFKTSKPQEFRKIIEARIEYQKNAFTSYFPEEVPKIDDCLIEIKDDLIILVVSKDRDLAKKIIEESIK